MRVTRFSWKVRLGMKRQTTSNWFDRRVHMVAGFVPDCMFHENVVERAVWQEGESERAHELDLVQMGVKSDRAQALPVTTYRCRDSGVLKGYTVD